MSPIEIDDKIMDAIRELINVGIGDAANALSTLVNSRVLIEVPDIKLVEASEIVNLLGVEIKELGVFIEQDFNGSISGKTMLFYSKECSTSLLHSVGCLSDSTVSFTQTDISTLEEIGNIVMGSCVSTICDLIQGRVDIHLPDVTIEISENSLGTLLPDLESFDRAIVIRNIINIQDHNINGHMFLLFSFHDLEVIIKKLLQSGDKV
jgi:chemotaxis protein CheC